MTTPANSPTNPERRRRLAEIEAAGDLQDARHEARQREYAEEAVENLIASLTDADMARLDPASAAIAHQLQALKDRLHAIPGFGEKIQTTDVREIDYGFRIDPGSGEIAVWLEIGAFRYWLEGSDAELRVSTLVHGGIERTSVAADGTLGEWEIAPDVTSN